MVFDTLHLAIILFLVVGFLFPIAPIILAFILSPRSSGGDFLMPYECGMVPHDRAWGHFGMNYYVYALIFIAFDVDVLYLFPISVFYGGSGGWLPFIELSYFVRDHVDAYPNRGTVTVTVIEADTPPVARDDRFLIAEDGGLSTTVEKLLRNDGDSGGPVRFAGLGAAAHGTVAMGGSGEIVFTPDKGYNGGEAGFYYQIQDASGNTSQGWASVGIVDVRHAPEQVADSLTVKEDQPLLFDAAALGAFLTDADGDSLFLEEVSNARGGTVTVRADGLYLFTPEKGFTGQASFDYRAGDGYGGVVSGRVEVHVEAGEEAPVSGDGLWAGRGADDAPDVDTRVYFTARGKGAPKLGEFARVKVTGVDGYDLIGETVG